MENYVIAWDIETSNKIEDQVGKFREDKIRKLSVSCACTLKLSSELILQGKEEQALAEAESSTFWIDGEGGLEGMLKQFDDAELLISYNGNGFDHLVMSQYYHGNRARELSHTFKSHDFFRKIIDAQQGRWPKLDKLLELNGESSKTANGLIAITWWAQGERAKLEEYCRSDVHLMTKLALRRDGIRLDGNEPFRAPATLVGVAPALAAQRFCYPVVPKKREREEESGVVSGLEIQAGQPHCLSEPSP
jgi:hypothetical protein